jgi:hypothetical protein
MPENQNLLPSKPTRAYAAPITIFITDLPPFGQGKPDFSRKMAEITPIFHDLQFKLAIRQELYEEIYFF